jgi:peptidoglycan/LPS O-acetylase OafA/YrhL
VRSFSEVPDGRDNHFNLIRLFAAAAVLVSHSFPLTLGKGAEEPLDRLTGTSLGAAAVYVFFAISGFMISRSFDRRRDLAGFIAARMARIFPGLAVVLVLTAFLVAPLITSLPISAYFSDPAVWTYVPRNLSLRFLQYDLPGVFAGNAYPGAINGSLWTLVWEVACYGLVVLLGLVGFLRRKLFGIFLGLYLSVTVWAAWAGIDSTFLRLSLPFVIGMAIYCWRAILPCNWAIAAALVIGAGLLHSTFLWPIGYAVALSYVSLWLGHAPARPLLAFNRLGDYSYGTYIYAFPIQQLVAWLSPGCTPLEMIAWALPVTLFAAVLSWHLVESPMLERREQLADILRRCVALFANTSRSQPT